MPLSIGGHDEREKIQTEQSEDSNKNQIYQQIIKNFTFIQAGSSTKPIPEKRNYDAISASKLVKTPD